MYSPEVLQAVNHEKHKDLLRRLERQELVQLTGKHNTGVRFYTKAAGLIGTQMVKLGHKLPSYDAPAPSERVATKI